MRQVIICLGVSGTGKSTLGDLLSLDPDWYNLHPIEDIKRSQEKHFGYPPGYLDTVEGKAAFVPGTQTTNQSWMVDLYHFWKERVPEYSSFYLKSRLEELLLYSESNIFIQGVRATHEINTVLEIIKEINAPLVGNISACDIKSVLSFKFIYLLRDCNPESSDEAIGDLVDAAYKTGYEVIEFCNEKPLIELEIFADNIRWLLA